MRLSLVSIIDRLFHCMMLAPHASSREDCRESQVTGVSGEMIRRWMMMMVDLMFNQGRWFESVYVRKGLIQLKAQFKRVSTGGSSDLPPAAQHGMPPAYAAGNAGNAVPWTPAM